MVVYQKIQRELSQEARLSLRFKEAEKENKRNQKKPKGVTDSQPNYSSLYLQI